VDFEKDVATVGRLYQINRAIVEAETAHKRFELRGQRGLKLRVRPRALARLGESPVRAAARRAARVERAREESARDVCHAQLALLLYLSLEDDGAVAQRVQSFDVFSAHVA